MYQGRNFFFRTYGGTHIETFFAVAAENFFDRPQEMSHYNRKLYDHMCLMLNQNPLTHIDELA